jgi:hypothetical protein
VVAVFTEACRASESFLQFHQKRDANGSAMIYGLSIQRVAFTQTCLFIRGRLPKAVRRGDARRASHDGHVVKVFFQAGCRGFESRPPLQILPFLPECTVITLFPSAPRPCQLVLRYSELP